MLVIVYTRRQIQVEHSLPASIRNPSLLLTVFTARRSALHGLCDRNSVRPSVRLSVTLVDCVHTVRPTIMISTPYGSPIILVSEISRSSQNSKGVTPSEGVE